MPLPRRHLWPVLAAVLALHGLLLVLAWSQRGSRHPPALPVARMKVVWLEALRPPATPAAAVERPRPAPPAAPTLSPRSATPRPSREAPPPAFTAPAAAPAVVTPAAATAAPSSGASVTPTAATLPGGSSGAEAGPPPPPLRLDLPTARRGGMAPSPAQQAVERQAGGSAPLSAEARLARRLDTTWTEENLGDGRIRLRRGDDCVILKETTASQLDPWNNRGPAPRGASPCP